MTSKNSGSNDELNKNELIVYIQRFTASSIALLTLLQDVVKTITEKTHTSKEVNSKNHFLETTKTIIENLRDDDFDYGRFVKKVFTVLKTQEQCKQLREKNPELFNVRDENGKIQTLLPGVNIKFAYEYLNENNKVNFWQYIYLLSSSVFSMIRQSNGSKFEKYTHVIETLATIETEISKTGVMFQNQIFNPFLGLGEVKTNYSVGELFTGGELPKQQNISIDSVLNMLGVDKMFDEKKINEQLSGMGDKEISEATERISALLGANGNSNVKEVCGDLVKEIVTNLRTNGLNNIGETLRTVAEKAKSKIDANKMKETASTMKNFMTNGQERLKDLKDEKGNPIGQQLLNNISTPLNLMKMMNFNNMDNNDLKVVNKNNPSVSSVNSNSNAPVNK